MKKKLYLLIFFMSAFNFNFCMEEKVNSDNKKEINEISNFLCILRLRVKGNTSEKKN